MTSILRTPSLGSERRHVDLGHRQASTVAAPSAPDVQVEATPPADSARAAVHAPMQPPPLAVMRPEPPLPPPTPTREELARELGYLEGLDKGYGEGHAKGLVEGKQAGLSQGLQEAQVHAEARMAEELQRMHTLTAGLQEAHQHLSALVEDDAIEAVFAAVVQVAGDAHTDRDGLRAVYRHALAQVRDQRELRLHAHPDDLSWLRSVGELEGLAGGSASTLQWIPDPDVTLGGCRVVSRGGELDARLDAQLMALKALLLNVRTERRLQADAS
jgi:flagellar assembly protein FliH